MPENLKIQVNLNVQTKPKAAVFIKGRDVTEGSMTFHQGDQVEIQCKGTGFPEPEIKWFSNGERLVTSRGFTVNGDLLIIEKADHDHVRTYQCLADNGVSVGHASVAINVQCKYRNNVQ